MTLSNITDRGTLRGVIYRGAGSGTTDYTQLTNKPQINGHTLQGDQSGDDLDLIDKNSLQINVGYAGNILHNIKYNDELYSAYATPFSGASSGGNGTMGLVPAPLSNHLDYDKFLKGNGTWGTPNSGITHTTIFNTKTNLTNGLTVLTSDFSNAKNLIFMSGVCASNQDQYIIAYAPLSILKSSVVTWICAAANNNYGIRFRAIPSVNNDSIQFLEVQKWGWIESPYIYQIIAES